MKFKYLSVIMLIFVILLAFSACGGDEEGLVSNEESHVSSEESHVSSDEHEHSWQDATCISAKTCTACGIETGSILTSNHNHGEWQTVSTLSCDTDGVKK